MSDPTPTTPITIRDQIITTAVEALSTLRGTPAADLAQLVAALAAQRDDLADGLYTQSNPRSPYLLLLSGQLEDLADRLDKIQMVLGADPYDSTETGNIRAILLNIMYGQGNIGINPDNATGAIQATGNITQNGRRYVVWSQDIPGLTRSNNNISLTPVSDWSGYSIYVQTSADTCWIGANQDVPTNSWLEAPLTGTIEVSVESQYQVRGYMRTPAMYYGSGISTHQGVYFVLWSTPLIMGTRPANQAAGEINITNDLQGWTLKNNSNQTIQIGIFTSNTAGYGQFDIAPGGTYTVPVASAYVYVQCAVSIAPNTAAWMPPT